MLQAQFSFTEQKYKEHTTSHDSVSPFGSRSRITSQKSVPCCKPRLQTAPRKEAPALQNWLLTELLYAIMNPPSLYTSSCDACRSIAVYAELHMCPCQPYWPLYQTLNPLQSCILREASLDRSLERAIPLFVLPWTSRL